jgi:hypothetical protein
MTVRPPSLHNLRHRAVAAAFFVAGAGCSASSPDVSYDATDASAGGASATGGAGGAPASQGGAAGKGGGAAGKGGTGGAGGGSAGTAGMGCGLVTCTSAGATCGKIGDGCGALIDCGACTAPQTCGGGGTPNVCGADAAACKPKTCKDLGFDCGQQGDGCGAVLDCGTCTAPATCGGGGTPSVCGKGGACTGLCTQQVQCAAGSTTTVSGTVYAATPPQFGKPDPLYNAVVYIPNGPVKDFTTTVSCDRCDSDANGPVLVTTTSGSDGKFQLQNAPVGKNIPLVIQVGKWRRYVTVDVAACVDNPLTQEQTRLPRSQKETSPYDNVPQIAVSTGGADGLECVLRKIGIADGEFTVPLDQGGTGRVSLYKGNGATDATGKSESETVLESSPKTLSSYDMVVFDCQGKPYERDPAHRKNLVDYANQGGRIFATHYSYTWLYDTAPFSTTADWSSPDGPQPNENNGNMVTGIIDQSFPKGAAFAKWLDVVGASTSQSSGKMTISLARGDLPSTTVNSQVARRWIYTDAPDPQTVQHYTFNTPVGPPSANQCGRVLFSDFHVTGSDGLKSGKFPSECSNDPLTPQERVLEFMLFDLSACVQTTPVCTPTTCQAQGISCGAAGDGCGNLLQCGSCAAPATCGGGGTPGQCGTNKGCTPKTCATLGFDCGPAGDGCGGVVQCGTCTSPQTCGGAGTPGKCGGTPSPG